MVDAKLVRESQVPAVAGVGMQSAGGQAGAPAPNGVPTNMVNQLTRFVPTETLTLYVAYLTALGGLSVRQEQDVCWASFSGRWIGVIAFALVSAALALGLTYGKAKRSNQSFTWPIFEMITAAVAFCAWAFALPDTPLADICSYSPAWGAFILLTTTVTIAVVAWRFNKAPDYEKIIASQ
jgi:hypothetical protein